MNWVDFTIVLLVTIPTFFGFRKGFLRKFLGIAGIIVGFILAVRFYEPLSSFLNRIFSGNLIVMNIISFLLIIACVYGFTVWLSKFISGMNSGTTMIDKTAGALFGFIQGIIISSVLLFNLSLIDFPEKKERDSSVFYKRIYGVAPAIFDKVISFSPELEAIYNKYKQKIIPS